MDRRKFPRHATAARLRRSRSQRRRSSRAPPSNELLVAEPVHSTGYLPMYIAMANDYFAEADIDGEDRHHRDRLRPHQRGAVRTGLRLHRRPRAQRLRQGERRRAARRRALRRPRQRLSLRGQGPGAARTGIGRLTSRARRSPSAPIGGTPNSITRYLLGKWKLDAKTRRDADRDAQLRRSRRGQGRASRDRRQHRADDHARHSKRFLERAVLQRAEGARPLRLFDHQRPPRFDPEGAGGGAWLRARHGEGPEISLRQPNGSAEIAKKQFPTMALEDLKATLDRSFTDEMWSKDGMISQRSLGHRQGRGDGGRHSQDRRQI